MAQSQRFWVLFLFIQIALAARAAEWQPPAGHRQIAIWPNAAPDLQTGAGPEDDAQPVNKLVGGRPWIAVGNVVRPTITLFSPNGANTGAAVLVFPGGGYTILAIDLEGTEVCDWLTSAGITCVLVKYRVPGVGHYPKSAPYPKSGPYPFSRAALQDAQRAIRLVRFHAHEWHIDPQKIGVLGFSAGGHLVAAASTHFEKSVYPPLDSVDNESARPDFAVALYPGHLTLGAVRWDAKAGGRAVTSDPHSQFGLNPDIRVKPQTPPTFLVQATDDPVDDVENSVVYYAALQKAGISAELHLFAHGGHAFGLRKTNLPVTEWPELMSRWLRNIGVIAH